MSEKKKRRISMPVDNAASGHADTIAHLIGDCEVCGKEVYASLPAPKRIVHADCSPPSYQIETRIQNQWTTNGVGDQNVFATREEAEAAIEELRKLGDDWAMSEYRVTVVRD